MQYLYITDGVIILNQEKNTAIYSAQVLFLFSAQKYSPVNGAFLMFD